MKPNVEFLLTKFAIEVYETFNLGEYVRPRQLQDLPCLASYARKTRVDYAGYLAKMLVETSDGHFRKVRVGVYEVVDLHRPQT